MREKEYLIAIISDHGILRAEMEAVIKRHAAAKLAPKELEDRYADQLLALVKQKERANQDVVEAPANDESDEASADIIDLMEVLRASLGKSGSGTRKAAKKRGRKSA